MERIKMVLIYDYTTGAYWRSDSNGYTSSKYEAGLYEEERAIRTIKGLTERKMCIEPAPEDHPILLKAKIKELENKIISLSPSSL